MINNCKRVDPNYKLIIEFENHLNTRAKTEGKSGLIILTSIIVGIIIVLTLGKNDEKN